MANNFFNAATQIVTIYSPEGVEHSCTRLNALDLIRSNGYKWNHGAALPVEAAAADTDEAPDEAPAEAETLITETTIDADPFDPHTAPLAEVAERLIGSNDVAKYLEGFAVEALRVMAEERFGQRVHHKASKASVIDKIVGWEEEKTAAESEEV